MLKVHMQIKWNHFKMSFQLPPIRGWPYWKRIHQGQRYSMKREREKGLGRYAMQNLAQPSFHFKRRILNLLMQLSSCNGMNALLTH